MKTLNGKRIALIIAEGYDRDDLQSPCEALIMAGADIELVSIAAGPVRSAGGRLVSAVHLARAVGMVASQAYHGLVIPGGAASVERLRRDRSSMTFIHSFVQDWKHIAAIGHGLLLLSDLGFLNGVAISSSIALRGALLNGGAIWMNEPVAVDGRLVSGRSAKESTVFNNTMVEVFAGQGAPVSI